MSQTHDFSFGSRAWNEYHLGRNKDGHRAKTDRAVRVQAAFRYTLTRAGMREMDDQREAELRADHEAQEVFWGAVQCLVNPIQVWDAKAKEWKSTRFDAVQMESEQIHHLDTWSPDGLMEVAS